MRYLYGGIHGTGTAHDDSPEQPLPQPDEQPAPAGDDELREAVSLLTDIPEETPAVLVEEAAATVLVELERLRAEQHEMTCPACQATIRSRLADTAARAEVERLRRALAGHLFDGESLSTREALRSELVEQGLKDSAEVPVHPVDHSSRGTAKRILGEES